MNENTKREKIRKYFSKSHPGAGIVFILIGLVVTIFSEANRRVIGDAGVILGTLICGVGLLGLVISIIRKGGRLSDTQVDTWLEEDLHQIIEKSYNKLGLDKSLIRGEPLLIVGPILWATTGVSKKDLLYRKGKDDIVRFAVYRATIIQLTDQLLAAYACDFNFLKNVTLNEETNEYHYRDITSVSTHEISTSYKLPNGRSLVHAQAFRLSVVGGENIQVTIGAEKLAGITGGDIPTTGAEKAVQVIRTMLREKK